MTTLANGANVTLTLGDYDSVTVTTLGVATLTAVSGLGVPAGKLGDFTGSRTLGPFAAGQLTIAALVTACQYEVADGVRPSAATGGAVAAITGSYVVGQTLTATFPAGVTGTIQFTRTLATTPFTKTAISGAVASAVNSLAYVLQAADIGNNIGVDCTTVQAASGGLVPGSSATLRQVATGTHIMNTLAASNTTACSRTPHTLMSAVSSLAIVLPNWYVGGQTETNAGSATWTAAIEYPEGVYNRVTFGGANSVTSATGGNIVSDQMPMSIPKGAKFWVRLFQNAPSKAIYFIYYAGDGTAQFISPATDMTMGGQINATSSAAFQSAIMCPIAIIGMSSDPAIGVYGDSISVGRGDTADAGVPLQGHLGRAFGAAYATGHVGVSGDRMSTFLAGNAKRMSLATYFTHFAINMGINDLTSGDSTATVAANTNSVVALFPSNSVALCTLSPVTTSTDVWATTANQAVVASNGNRITENTRRLAGVPGVKVLYDVNPIVETVASPESGIWKAPSYTADGTHPAATGYKAEAAAINVALLTA